MRNESLERERVGRDGDNSMGPLESNCEGLYLLGVFIVAGFGILVRIKFKSLLIRGV